MSSNRIVGRAPTETELLEWMKQKSRTFGWTAWVAYDHTVLNRSLWDDYFERADSHPFSEPFSGKAEISENAIWENLYSVRLGAPMVSFERSDIASPRVTLSARALSGTQLSVEVAGGSAKHITRIAEYSPLQAPRLVAEAFIDDDGAAYSAGQVRMDLSRAEAHQFSFPGTRQQQLNGGLLFHESIMDLPEPSRHCVLNLLGEWNGGLLVPEKVAARPVPLEDAAGRRSCEGAVVLMVAATGSDVGQIPDISGDWKYPIPSGCNASLWIGNDWVMGTLLASGIRAVSSDAEFTYDTVGDPSVLTVTKGTLQAVQVEPSVAPIGKLTYSVDLPLAGNPAAKAHLEIERGESGLHFNWKTSTFAHLEAPSLVSASPVGTTALDNALRIQSTYQFARQDNGSLGLIRVTEASRWIKPVYRQGKALDPVHYQHFPAITQAVADALSTEIGKVEVRMLSEDISEVDRLQLDGIKFPRGAALALDAVHLPRDLALFGTVSAGPERFMLSPLEGRVLAGGTLQFEGTSGHSGITWSVEPVQGFSGTPGTVSATGLYRAPAATEIDGSFGLAKVTAASATHLSSVLVSVLTETLALNPLVFAVSSAQGRVRMSAGSLDGGELTWSLTSATGAMLEEPDAEDGTLSEPGDHLYVRGNGGTGAFFSVDEVTVRTLAGHERTTPILVVEKNRIGEIRIAEQPGLRADQIQLEFHGGGGQPIPDAQWKVQIGGGSITPDGLYTLDPQSKVPFAVITAEYEIPNAHLGNFLILPIPLVDLADLKRALD